MFSILVNDQKGMQIEDLQPSNDNNQAKMFILVLYVISNVSLTVAAVGYIYIF